MWDAMMAYQNQGGWLMYMGAKAGTGGIAYHPEAPGLMTNTPASEPCSYSCCMVRCRCDRVAHGAITKEEFACRDSKE